MRELHKRAAKVADKLDLPPGLMLAGGLDPEIKTYIEDLQAQNT